MNSSCGDRRARRAGRADVVQEGVVEAADEAVAVVERERVADERPGDGRDAERGDAHHERVERVLRAHEPGVEEAERRRHQQDERGRGEHPRGVAGVDAAGHRCDGSITRPPGSRRRASVSPVRIRTTRSSGTTKILPSPTSPVRAPSQSASIVGSTNSSETAISKRDLLGEPHLHGRAAVGLDAVELAAVALDAAHRDAAHLGAVERFEHVVGLLRPDDRDHEFHGTRLLRAYEWDRRSELPHPGAPRSVAGGREPICRGLVAAADGLADQTADRRHQLGRHLVRRWGRRRRRPCSGARGLRQARARPCRAPNGRLRPG